MKYAAGYGLALVLFLALDALWLGLVARGTYVARMGDLLADPPRWGVAALFYVVYVVGLTYFAVAPGIDGKGWTWAALNGALFGFFCYLTYDATALSVIKGFDPMLAAIDVAWGTLLSAVCAGLSVAVLSWTRLAGA